MNSPQIPLNLDFVKYLGLSYEAAILLRQIEYYHKNNEDQPFSKTQKEFSDFLCLSRRKFQRALKEIEIYLEIQSEGKSGTIWGINKKELSKAYKAIENKMPIKTRAKKKTTPQKVKSISSAVESIDPEKLNDSFYLTIESVYLDFNECKKRLLKDAESQFRAKRAADNSGKRFEDLFNLFLELNSKRNYTTFKEFLNHLTNWVSKGGYLYAGNQSQFAASNSISYNQNKRNSLIDLINKSS